VVIFNSYVRLPEGIELFLNLKDQLWINASNRDVLCGHLRIPLPNSPCGPRTLPKRLMSTNGADVPEKKT
jgi:hypothetical protein